MTGQEALTKFENMVTDELDQDLEIQLYNDAKNQIEESQLWEKLKKKDLTQSVTAGQTQATTHPLPTRFALPIKLQMLTDRTPYSLINFEDQYMYQDNSRLWFIDFASETYAITGTIGKSDNVVLFYQEYSTDLASGTLNSYSWSFPTRFHDLIPLKMAQIYYAIDGGEKARAWDDRWGAYYQFRLEQMRQWDAMLKMQAKVGESIDSGSNPLVAF